MDSAKRPLEAGTEIVLRHRLTVRGIVQGVGFRPYVFRLAKRYGLNGFVKNTSLGAVIEVEGGESALQAFERALPTDGPPLMRVVSADVSTVALANEVSFSIHESENSGNALTWVPADVSVCKECLTETEDPGNRRYEYPFTNCTNCGPRYSIIRDVPYDREQTTMDTFRMCELCQAEYHDPSDRRFHAQPNACASCGPRLWAADSCGKELPMRDARSVLEVTVNLLRGGGIVALKGLGGYQILCDARNEEAVQKLRKRKHRNRKPLAVMVQDETVAATLCEVSEFERCLLTGAEKPIVLLHKRCGTNIAESVAPATPWFGIMLPCTPLHALLFRVLEEKCGAGIALVATSGNLSEVPIVIEEGDAQKKLQSVVDMFLHHNRPIHTRVDDSVLRAMEGKPLVLRRARGFVPGSFSLGEVEGQILACGAQQKSTLCLTKGGFAMLSQHLGDLENYESLQFFEETSIRMQQLFQSTPEAVAYDLHPGYLSTQFAKKLAVPHIGVQHHHAHIASCMAEHGLHGPVLGVAWDGTGFGLDGTIWGGEFLVADRSEVTRYGHLRCVALAGGDAAVREPWRVARSYLLDAFDAVVPRGLGWHSLVPDQSVRILDALLEKRIHTIESSSCGRLFDAVASLIGLHQVVSFEGEAAMALEAIADDAKEVYGFSIGGYMPLEVDMRPMIRQIVDDTERSVAKGTIAARFHNTLVRVMSDVCARMREETGYQRVCLSGGCFQNIRLLRRCVRMLRSNGFEVFFQQQVPCNDGGIALGQAAIALELMRRGL
jgi:hydrogenase maturation protein HypF